MPEGSGRNGEVFPLPRYLMCSKSEPPFNTILQQLAGSGCPMIGSSYYYIRADSAGHCLCRLTPTPGPVLFHEILDPRDLGIADDEIRDAICSGTHPFTLPGLYAISAGIAKKLQARGAK